MNKIIRSICWFAESPSDSQVPDQLNAIESQLREHDYEIQTKRVCFKQAPLETLPHWDRDHGLFLSLGSLDPLSFFPILDDFLKAGNLSVNLDLTDGVKPEHIEPLFEIIRHNPAKTFNFAYTFHNQLSSPFFPSASFERPGFALGLQPTNLSAGCSDLPGWFRVMASVWQEICQIFEGNNHFLGIDSSVAPLFLDHSSLVHFMKQLYGGFSKAVTTDCFIRISDFITKNNPKPVGLCGLMLPCLEDFELAAEYEAGHFTIERNLFLALHSGLGIDTYPIGIDEKPERILAILKLLQKLSIKYKKPLSARMVSDGKTKIGEMSDFQNQYLKDVKIRPL
jgi:hypothetical protein